MSAAPDPGDAEAVLAHGRAALRAAEEEAALPLLAEAVRRQPGEARLWELLGQLYRALDALAPAADAFDRAAALAPDDPGIASGRACMHQEAGRPATALFDRALALAPADDGLRFGRVSAILAERGRAAALATLEGELAERPGWTQGQARLANLRWQSGDRAGFTRELERALEQTPYHLDLWGALLAALSRAGLHEELRAAARCGRDAGGAHLMFDAYEAAALDRMGEIEAAAPLYAAMQPIGDPSVALFHLAHLFRAGRIGEAAALAEHWSGTSAGALFVSYLGVAWRLLGDSRWAWLEGDERLVGIYDLGEAVGPLDALAARLRALHLARGAPLDQSVRGGSQTEGALFARTEPEIRALRAALARAVRGHIDQLPPRDPVHPTLGPPRDRPIRFAGSWSVRLAGGGSHVVHRHSGGWLSSAFYVALPDEAERGPGEAGWLALGEAPEEIGIALPPTRLIEPRPGLLVLFPSTMWHGTRPFVAGERLTVAFDVAMPLS
ncbi:MAG TPA: putative 2OG-Fe(II) oxygenase [Allosphingosinicella sp.]|nr:putative 2OG-Fe(II) oxygenase [Allosphingosinicella sp.]